jgi:hypothetical protein
MKSSCFKIATASTVIVALIFVSISGSYQGSSAASSSQFAAANTAIQSAYTSVYQSEVKDHANVANLVTQLNNATQFVNKAYSENSTDPTQATTDLATAQSIAQKVSNETAAASSSGIRAHQLQTFESVGVAFTVISSAGLIYILSDSLYRRWWIKAYGTYIVRMKKKSKNAN